jgi:predicted transcriptional regulator
MDVVWEGGELPVRDVQARLARRVAYTTVMTTLDRLFKKGFVTRRREGRAFLYTAALGRLEIEASMTASLLSGVLGGEDDAARPFLSNLVDAVGDRNGQLLDELERLVRDKRQQLRKERE